MKTFCREKQHNMVIHYNVLKCDCLGGVKWLWSFCYMSHYHTWNLFSSLTKLATFILLKELFLDDRHLFLIGTVHSKWKFFIFSCPYCFQTEWLSNLFSCLFRYAVWSCHFRFDIIDLLDSSFVFHAGFFFFLIMRVNHDRIFIVIGWTVLFVYSFKLLSFVQRKWPSYD